MGKPRSKLKPSTKGQIFGSWRVQRDDGTDDKVYPPTPKNKYGQRVRRVLAECLSCGVRKVVVWQSLVDGTSRNCVKCADYGSKQRKPHHDLIGSPTYGSWANMKQRCTNPANPGYWRYGGGGRAVCERWRQFEHFLEDMGICPEGQSIHRINNELGYFKENCRWATGEEQAANRSPVRPGKYVGVYQSVSGLRYLAYFRKKFIGSFDAAEEAAHARDQAAREYSREHYGEETIFYLNFPD